MTLWTLGLASSHDSCVCLLEDDRIAAAIAVERLVRVKRAVVTEGLGRLEDKRVRAGYLEAIRACCEVAGIQPADIDQIAVASPDCEDDAEIDFNTALLSAALPRARCVHMPHPEHHLAHAYSAFFCSGFDSAAALVADSFGTPVAGRREEHTGLHFTRADALPEVVFKHLKPDAAIVPRPTDDGHGWTLDRDQLSGMGEIYRLVTILLGFSQSGTKFDDAGKTMGLAPYGRRLSEEPVLMRPQADGTLDCSGALGFFEARNLVTRTPQGLRLSVRGPGTPLSSFHQDLAAQVQWELERAAVHLARHLRERTGATHLVLAGGVFLNAVANRRIVEEAGFEQVYAIPAATDDGTAVGAAYFAYQQARLRARRPVSTRALRHVGLGPTYGAEPIGRELMRWPVPAERLGSLEAAAEAAGERLARGQIVGWFQGGSELGPRALGHRSILADPQDPQVKDTLNARVKFREGFRPFAPAVLQERAHELFALRPGESVPFMLQIVDVREPYRAVLPGGDPRRRDGAGADGRPRRPPALPPGHRGLRGAARAARHRQHLVQPQGHAHRGVSGRRPGVPGDDGDGRAGDGAVGRRHARSKHVGARGRSEDAARGRGAAGHHRSGALRAHRRRRARSGRVRLAPSDGRAQDRGRAGGAIRAGARDHAAPGAGADATGVVPLGPDPPQGTPREDRRCNPIHSCSIDPRTCASACVRSRPRATRCSSSTTCTATPTRSESSRSRSRTSRWVRTTRGPAPRSRQTQPFAPCGGWCTSTWARPTGGRSSTTA
ncbi:MAG: hypothetical protein KDK70_12110 [Myxococcales bacterium]|nr:hypothetical protein [Myxococcales bacterium]